MVPPVTIGLVFLTWPAKFTINKGFTFNRIKLAFSPMKDTIRQLIETAATRAHGKGLLPSADFPEVNVEVPKLDVHGDFSTNFAMLMPALQKMSPRKIAEVIVDHLTDARRLLERVDIAGPGFINFYLKPAAWHPVLQEIHNSDRQYGASDLGRAKKIQVEFVSSNPTGPLHVGHGRGAAVGDSVANILSFCGYDVQREYYINDSGRQIQTLGRSVFLRYRELFGEAVDFPENFYQGDYIRDIAVRIKDQHGEALLHKEKTDAVMTCARVAADDILAGIRNDLDVFGVAFDEWFSEQSLYDSGKVDKVITDFRTNGNIYEHDGAQWFKTSNYGDEKDRVVVRGNGQTTYFASDIAYHQDKYVRGIERVIDVWGADHHGYIPRMTAAVEACGHDRSQFHVILVQLVNLLRGGEPVAMSTRAGEFVTLREVIDEVGKDAARFIFLTRHYDSPLDFDLEIAKQQTNENPVYYVQYVHARISSIVRKAAEQGIEDIRWDDDAVALLHEPEEIQLIKSLARYPETVAVSAENLEPHRVTYYLMSLAAAFHAYYNKQRVLSDDPVLSRGRLYLVAAVRKVIRNGLGLLGVSAPEKM
jgi:arginyl-tRNA synthetase